MSLLELFCAVDGKTQGTDGDAQEHIDRPFGEHQLARGGTVQVDDPVHQVRCRQLF